MQIAHPHFDVVFGCFVFGLGLFAFQKISLGFDRTFFIIGGMDCSFLRLRGVGLSSFVGLPLTANGSAIWRITGRETEPYRSILNMV